MGKETNMTTGNPLKLIAVFSFPLILANLGQQFYTIVDAMIVGKGVGVEALAAVGATDWAYWLALWAIQALAQGFAIPVSQSFGEGDPKKVRACVAMSVKLCLVTGIALTGICFLIAKPLLIILKTPENIFDGAYAYLFTMYAGLLIVIAYNMASSILRAFGNGRTPLIAIIVAGVTNIILDILFVLVFQWGILGAAVATVSAQLLAFLYCFTVLRKMDLLKFEKEDWKLNRSIIKRQCQMGVPLALQHVLITIGGMILQSAINQQGFIFIAGFTATNKIYGLLESSAISVGYATTTFVAQNYGAAKYDRIRTGLKNAAGFAAFLSIFVSGLMLVAGKKILWLFIDTASESAVEVHEIAWHYLIIMCCLLIVLYMLHVTRCTLQGLGNSTVPFWSGVMEFFARVSAAVFFSRIWGSECIFFAEPFAWTAATVILVWFCLKEVKKLPKVIET